MLKTIIHLLSLLLITSHAAFASERQPPLRLALPQSAPEAIWAVAQEFKQAVTTRTGGTVKIEIERNASAYQDHEIVSVVSSGTIEIGGTTLNQFAYDVPLAGVFLQPFMFNFNTLVQAAAQPGSEIRRLVDDEILYWTNTRVLWWQPMGSNIMVSRGVLPDGASMANLPIGAPDDQSKELIRICGGEPYLMPTAELSSALESGKISAAITDILSVKAYNLWRVANTVINTQHAPSLYLVVINDRVWQGLPAERQQVIAAAASELQAKTWDRFVAIEADAYAQAARMGMKVYIPSPQDIEAWRVCSSPLLESYIERIGEPGQKLFAAYGKLRADPCCREAPFASPPTMR